MKYRETTRIIGKLYVLESAISLITGAVFVVVAAFILFLQDVPGSSKVPFVSLLCIVALSFGLVCYLSLLADIKLLKSTDWDMNPPSAIRLSRQSTRLTMMIFGCRLTLLFGIWVANISFHFDPLKTVEWEISFPTKTNIFGLILLQLSFLILFPGLSGIIIYFGGCWPYNFNFSMCREVTGYFMFILVLFRVLALYCVIKFNTQKIELPPVVAAYHTSSECPELEGGNSGVRYIPRDPGGNIITNICTDSGAIHFPLAATEIVELTNPLRGLPRYEDVVCEEEPPSYAEIFKNHKMDDLRF